MPRMMKFSPDAPFQTITNAAAVTGLSVYFLRNGVKNGTVPYIKSGETYMVNVPLLLERLNAESLGVTSHD